jgi:proline-specific peptidase
MSWEAWPCPPGQERRPPPPTKDGTVLFKIPSTGDLCETYYVLWGTLTSPRPPLICLHGGPGIIHDYLLPLSLLSTSTHPPIPVLMYDQIGCGKSTRFPTRKGDSSFFTPALFMAELDNLIRALAIPTYDLFGHSWGGMLAVQFAATRQPAGLRKLILCSSPADMPTLCRVTESLRERLPPDILAVLDTCERDGTTESPDYQAATIEFYRRHLCRAPGPFPAELLAAFAAMAEDSTVYSTMNGPSEFTITGSLRAWSIVGELPAITERTAPGGVLLMNGLWDQAQDPCVQPYFDKIKARVKWAQFALSSHMPWLEETERFLGVLGGFLLTE